MLGANLRFLAETFTDIESLRDLLLVPALSEHESGAPVAITTASKEPKSDAAETEGELTAAGSCTFAPSSSSPSRSGTPVPVPANKGEVTVSHNVSSFVPQGAMRCA